MASESTKLQVNFKLADGALINLYADDAHELHNQLGWIADLSPQISRTSKALAGQGNLQSAVDQLSAGLGATVIGEPPVTNFAAHAAPVSSLSFGISECKHGARTYRESKPGAPKAWKGYFCPTAKGTADQCEPNFAKQQIDAVTTPSGSEKH